MATDIKLDELKKLVEELNKEEVNFGKDGASRKTPEYKQKKISKATTLYEQINIVIAELTKLMTSPDPCLELEKTNVTASYKRYLNLLQQIRDGSGSSSGDAEKVALQLFEQKQNVRFEGVRKNIEDVNAKIVSETSISSAYYRMKLKAIQDNWERIQKADEDAELDRTKLSTNYQTQMEDYEVQVERMVLILQTELDKRTDIGSHQNDDVKLPRVTIPKFKGDYFEWMSFRDLFVTMVKDKKNLSDGQKMQLLKTVVEGEASTLIADLTIADINFDSAWTRLLERYDNNRVVVYKHLNKLITQPASKNDSKSLKRILDTTDQVLLALQNLGRPIESWDDWIIMTIVQKLSEETRKDWERIIGASTDLPTWEQLKKFLGEQFRMLEGLENTNRNHQSKQSNEKVEQKVVRSYQSTVVQKGCPACEGEHKLFSCTTFKTMEVQQRWDLAKKQKLCFACLIKHEDKIKCDKQQPCKKCKKRHSTWLHDANKEKSKGGERVVINNAHGRIESKQSQGLLATMLVLVQNRFGQQFFLRALVDSGSQASMITSKAVVLLNENPINSPNNIKVLGGSQASKTQIVHIKVQPRFSSNCQLRLECYVLKKLTEPLPNKDIDITSWRHLKGLILADPMFNKVGSIDLLLGADAIGDILLPNIIRGSHGTPMAQETRFGWIISGRFDTKYERKTIKCLVSTIQEDGLVQSDLSRFWELENLDPKRLLTKEEKECEKFYKTTYKRNEHGNFVVKIPFKQGQWGPERLGDSKKQCMARFMYLEKRFAKDESLKKDYVKVMEEYLDMGHMTEVDHLPQQQKLYYIPHHAVIKPDSLTTKTRVVFDASAQTSKGVSLNECMLTGGKQQDDLMDILIRWRKYPIVFKADIEKIYRMIKLDRDDQRYHTILWRKDPTHPLKEYQLNTVTFGTAAAPFMATRTLNQIAENVKNAYPLAYRGIKNGFYVDALIYGCDTIEEARNCKDEINKSLEEGGLNLRKWTSNNEQFLKTIPPALTERSLQSFEDDDSTKALGLRWNPRSDTFGFSINWNLDDDVLTKRLLLSQASKLFDPLGWCAPVILNAKLMMQQVWNEKIDWDELVPQSINEKWMQLRSELQALGQLTINRWIGFTRNDDVQLHGFSDASEKAYSAVVYTRVEKEGFVEIQLIAAKTRVAPVKTKTTLPRMELCGAVLLAQLMMSVKEALQLENLPMIAWSDSTVTLGWLKGEPLKWKTFVANRTSEIQSTLVNDWRYCPSKENPADCASRGIMPEELLKHSLWWNGPAWLKEGSDAWPQLKSNENEPELEQRKVAVNVATVERNELLLGASSWFHTLRVLAYCLRFRKHQSVGARLTVQEIETVKYKLIKRCQLEEFPQEVHDLTQKLAISPKSRLVSLNPFMDENGIIRVGGRLRNAMLSYENKHPIILPATHDVTKLIVKQMHMDTLHGGPQLMLALLRTRYWILHGKRTVSDEYKRCLNYRRLKGQTTQQKMGDLPMERVTLERAFIYSGVDYCGPVEIRSSKLRNAKLLKGYIAVFVCLGTRATHLELVSDMTTSAFLAAFNRFIARRGLCRQMHSDNGSNFVGAYNKIAKNEQLWLQEKNVEVASLVVNKGIDWKFIPPGSPNFGGIWERNVRSVKDHLKRTLKTVKLTFEEYGTLLCQIEACLNSRPLCPLTADVENFNALTPGHFLIGEALMAPPELSLSTVKTVGIDRWKLIQCLKQQFWRKWSQEYLVQLQQRNKWRKGETIVNPGDLVLIKDEQLPPQYWLLGRIEETWPGKDGIVRVVTIRTHKGIIKRPINKVCTLMNKTELEEPEANITMTQLDEKNHEIELHDLGPDVREYEPDQPIEKIELVKPVGSDNRCRKSNYNLRPRIPSLMTTMIMLLGLVIMLGGGSARERQEMVSISKFKNDAGIYFEELGRAQTIRTQWHIYIRFDLQRYRSDLHRLRLIEVELSELCTGLNSESSRGTCEDTTGLIDQQLARIEELNSLLENNGDENKLQQRKRRAAPISAVGWIQHELFGVMASEQAEEIDQQFKMVDQDAQYMLKLLKNQTSIVDSTVNIMKATEAEININYEKIERQIDMLYTETNVMKRKMKVMALSMYTLAFVNRIEQIQENILDMITDLHQGHVSSNVFSPNQFKEQVELMKNHLPMDSMVPEIAQHDIKSLYKLIKGSARVMERSIILEVVFPLVSNIEFQLWHVVPIPTTYEDKHITIIPEADYLMMSLKRDSFYTMSNKEVHTCLRPREKMFICSMKHILHTSKSTVALCERELLNNQLELSPTCTIKMTPEKEFWNKETKKFERSVWNVNSANCVEWIRCTRSNARM